MKYRLPVVALLLASCTGDPPADSDTSTGDTTAETTTTDTGTGTADTGATSTGDEPTSSTGPDTSDTTDPDTSTGEPVDILEQLLAIDGLVVEERESPEPGYRYFVLTYLQPADHDDPDGLQFAQRMTLLHRDSAAPLVLSTSGYFVSFKFPDLAEPSRILAANQLTVEHRFFTPSRPDPADWATLTIEQVAADLHGITGAFAGIYSGRRLATGVSKGGMTAVYYRRFYPDDVDATVAYVAPHSDGPSDPRYLDFVAQLGDPACRQALADVQRELLLRRTVMIERMQALAVDGYTFTLLGEDRALESAVVEMPFTFWQYGSADDCAGVPTSAASDDELWTFLDSINTTAIWADDRIDSFEPYFYQAATQLGYPGLDESAIVDLMLYPGLDVAATYVFSADPVFDPEAMPAISEWLSAEGRAMLFVYGENDPYTAAAFAPGDAEDTHVFIAPGQNHGAKIVDLAPADLAVALDALAQWSGVEPKIPRSSPLRRADDWRLRPR